MAVALHPERETRLLSITITDSAEQTRQVFNAALSTGGCVMLFRAGSPRRRACVLALGRLARVGCANLVLPAIPPFVASGRVCAPHGLDRLLIFNRRQLERILRVYVRHYNEQRPHRALALQASDPPAVTSMRTEPASGAIAIR
jgi:hypothetical protein